MLFAGHTFRFVIISSFYLLLLQNNFHGNIVVSINRLKYCIMCHVNLSKTTTTKNMRTFSLSSKIRRCYQRVYLVSISVRLLLWNYFIPVRVIYVLHSLSMFLKINSFRLGKLSERTTRKLPCACSDEGEYCSVSQARFFSKQEFLLA